MTPPRVVQASTSITATPFTLIAQAICPYRDAQNKNASHLIFNKNTPILPVFERRLNTLLNAALIS